MLEPRWYYSRSEDNEYWEGGYDTREEAIAHGLSDYDGETFWIVVADNPPLRLSDWIDDDLLERADERLFDSDRASSEHDCDAIFEATREQETDLVERIKKACDEWQEAHGLIFRANTFFSMGTPECIKGTDPGPDV